VYDQAMFNAIDVDHPKDYRDIFPSRHSEGSLIENIQYLRLLNDGSKEVL
jgi:hypothetical protein